MEPTVSTMATEGDQQSGSRPADHEESVDQHLEQQDAAHDEALNGKDTLQLIKDVAKKVYKDEEVRTIMERCFTVAFTRCTAEEMNELVETLKEKKIEWMNKLSSKQSETSHMVAMSKVFRLIARVSLSKASISEKELLDHVIKVGEGPTTPNKMTQGCEVVIHENMRSSDIVSILNMYPPSIDKAEHEEDDYKKSVICDQEREVEFVEVQAHENDEKVSNKRIKRYIKEIFTNFPEMIFKNLMEPLAISADGLPRCFMRGVDAENATNHEDAIPYDDLSEILKKTAWMKEETLKGSGLRRRIREASTMALDGIEGGNYKATNEDAGKSRLERILGKELFNALFSYVDTDAMKDNVIRLLRALDPAISKFTPGNFVANIYDEESSDEEGENYDNMKRTVNGRAWGEANLQLRKELLMLLNNLDSNEAFKKYRIVTTGNKRIKLNGFPGITKAHHEQNRLAMNILKEIVTKKPDTMNSDQTIKNGTNPNAALFNVARIQYQGYPLGALFNMLENAAHGIDGCFGSRMGIYMCDASTGSFVPYHFLNDWKNMKKNLKNE